MKTYNILFLCTHNSARSVVGEVLATQTSKGKFIGYSAGSTPGGKINPFAVEIAEKYKYDLSKLRSKSWDEYAQADAPQMDFIITVCDNAAGEVCPFWPGKPATAHWGYPDPSSVEGGDDAKRQAFKAVELGLKKRLEILLNLPLEKLDALSLSAELKNIAANN